MAACCLRTLFLINCDCTGPSNQNGLQLKSFRIDKGLEAHIQLPKTYQAFPGIMNGGAVGGLFDCHGNWTAAIALMDHSSLPKPPLTLTTEVLVRLTVPAYAIVHVGSLHAFAAACADAHAQIYVYIQTHIDTHIYYMLMLTLMLTLTLILMLTLILTLTLLTVHARQDWDIDRPHRDRALKDLLYMHCAVVVSQLYAPLYSQCYKVARALSFPALLSLQSAKFYTNKDNPCIWCTLTGHGSRKATASHCKSLQATASVLVPCRCRSTIKQ